MARKRHLSRIAVMQSLFQHEHREGELADILVRNMEELEHCDMEFAEKLLGGVSSKIEELKKIMEASAPEWTYERMDPIARCILLIGTYELQFDDDAPAPVVMNEAIEIAKNYGNAESGKFVNGVLNAIAKA